MHKHDAIEYRDFYISPSTISYAPGTDWAYVHKDCDVDDTRGGYAASPSDCCRLIDEWWAEQQAEGDELHVYQNGFDFYWKHPDFDEGKIQRDHLDPYLNGSERVPAVSIKTPEDDPMNMFFSRMLFLEKMSHRLPTVIIVFTDKVIDSTDT